MPGPKRNRRERTDEWASIKQWTLWPEQELYEQIRPIVLFHETAGERAKEIDVPQRTLARKADEFERNGMQSLFSCDPSDKVGSCPVLVITSTIKKKGKNPWELDMP